ncbi:3D domain-containing protein [Maribacter litopenaei]|uniref:3D domain-containing protein n=1 Tax=Maribacter litopenaei TaxID=2976127 RepID=A0ABY5YCJ6_9FLAO|nr:3D domain-containing protein [Maribacter litopenaei]UWX56541.1 3D domain-containing protein [Maribacter litopenaei]
MYRLLWILMSFSFISCSDRVKEDNYDWIPMTVTATAYNSFPGQTSYEHPEITAWGDSIKPGLKWIAVSRDLIRKGLRHNTLVKIDTFDGIYIVKDKMHPRWRNRIDIYMGEDRQKAKEWGRRKVEIQYAVKKEQDSLREIQK